MRKTVFVDTRDLFDTRHPVVRSRKKGIQHKIWILPEERESFVIGRAVRRARLLTPNKLAHKCLVSSCISVFIWYCRSSNLLLRSCTQLYRNCQTFGSNVKKAYLRKKNVEK